jgi:VWFA-related protein
MQLGLRFPNQTSGLISMKPVFYLLTILVITANTFAQSGRVKPAETPTPRPQDQPRVIYVPTQAASKSASPHPTPTPAGEDEVVKVASTLVPIPVSVLDLNGRSVSNLRLSDFELKIDGQVVEISELAQSETPIRLAMLFDNSSSVRIAREFEKDAAVKFFRRVIRPEKDLAALYSVATISKLEQSFTSDISSLTRAIELFLPPEGATALLEGIIEAADYLREVHGRRVMIIVSDGDDTKSDVTFDETVRALQVANCQVYVVKTTDFENFQKNRQPSRQRKHSGACGRAPNERDNRADRRGGLFADR